MHAIPAAANERITPGPALSCAATPVRTNMPVPITAPTPRLVKVTGPRTRRSRFSPFNSSSSRLRGFLSNSGFPIGLLWRSGV
jgi:hypothetical protein